MTKQILQRTQWDFKKWKNVIINIKNSTKIFDRNLFWEREKLWTGSRNEGKLSRRQHWAKRKIITFYWHSRRGREKEINETGAIFEVIIVEKLLELRTDTTYSRSLIVLETPCVFPRIFAALSVTLSPVSALLSHVDSRWRLGRLREVPPALLAAGLRW